MAGSYITLRCDGCTENVPFYTFCALCVNVVTGVTFGSNKVHVMSLRNIKLILDEQSHIMTPWNGTLDVLLPPKVFLEMEDKKPSAKWPFLNDNR